MKVRVANAVSRALRASAAASRRSLHSEGRTLVPAFVNKGGAAASSQITRAAAEAQDSSARGWFPAAFFLSAAAVVAQDQNLEAAEVERTFIAIKPDGVQRGLISKIIGRFERKGYKLVGIKLVTPSKEFAERHYDDLKGRPFFNGLTDFLSSGPVVAMVWEGQGVIKYGRKLIGQTSPQASEPGTIRGDYAIVVGRNIIHGSDGPETAEAEIKLWFSPEELNDYNLVSEKWLYE